MHALIVGAAPEAGCEDFYARLLAEAEVVVAADAAGEWCLDLGRAPELVVGDFDSAQPGAVARLERRGIAVETVSSHKDDSDLDLALLAARRLGARRTTFTAAFGARLDHTLASLGTLLSAADLSAEAVEPSLHAWVLDSQHRPELTLPLDAGRTVSAFALQRATGVTLEGFEYPLDDGVLEPLSSLGLSNRAARREPHARVLGGRLLLLAPCLDDTDASRSGT